MNLARFSVERPVAVTMRIAALVLLGAVCLTKLPVDLLPNVSIPTVAVVTQWPNVAPEEIETQITRPIEESVSSVENLYEVDSNTVAGVSTVRVQFGWGTDIGQGAVDVLQLVEKARQNFPIDPTLQAPVVYKYDPSQIPILVYGVSGINDSVKLRTLLDNQVTPIIESADGVASAISSGGDQRAIMVDVDTDRLRAHSLTANDVINRIAAENVNLPAGIARQGNTEYTIRSLGWFTDPKQIGEIPAGSFNGQLVPLHDVAKVTDSHQETREFTRLNGAPAVGLIISKQSGANTVAAAASVQEKLAQVHKMFPELKFGLAYDQARFINDSVNDVKASAIIGGLLAVLILLFFLRNIRSTLVVALSIPISIVSTFALLYMCGFTLNTMSLSGMALATGLIVDDAVVVLENIFRHIENEKISAREASVSGTQEIMSAVVASTITIMVVFLPLLLIKGQAGQMFTQFALVVIFSIAISLLDATTVVPMLASRLIQGDAHHEKIAGAKHNLVERIFARCGKWLDALDANYRNVLSWALGHRWTVIGGAVGVSVLSFALVPMIGYELMPTSDSGDLSIVVKLPVNTALAVTDKVMKQVEHVLLTNPNVETAFSAAGTALRLSGSTTSEVPYEGSVTVKLKDDRSMSTQDVIGALRKPLSRIPGARIIAQQTDLVSYLMTGGNQNIEADIFGPDLDTLSRLGNEAMARFHNVSGLENVDLGWQEASPELQFKVDRQKALQFGLSFTDIANLVDTATNGTIASYYQEKGFQYPIVVEVPPEQRKSADQLENLVVDAARPTSSIGGKTNPILLSQVSHLEYATGPSQITRMNRQRYVSVTGQPVGRSQSLVQDDMEKAMNGMQLPTGYYWSWGLNQRRQVEEFGGMNLAVIMAIALIYMLLASQFESFIHPLTILMSVPLSAIGVILALFLTNRTFGLTAFIGLLMLIGIVVKNGILLVDYTNQLRARGMSRNEAVLKAGPTRLRPILMTTCAAVLGMLPIASGLARGSETQTPMATAVIGGLLTSTLLTLLVVPTVYTLFDDLQLFIQGRRGSAAATGANSAVLSAATDGPAPAVLNGYLNGKTGNGHPPLPVEGANGQTNGHPAHDIRHDKVELSENPLAAPDPDPETG